MSQSTPIADMPIAPRQNETVATEHAHLKRKIKPYFTKDRFVIACRALIGVFLCHLTVFVTPLRFPGSCITAVIFVLLALLSPDRDIGCMVSSTIGALTGVVLSIIIGTVAVIPYFYIQSIPYIIVIAILGTIPLSMLRTEQRFLISSAIGAISLSIAVFSTLNGLPGATQTTYLLLVSYPAFTAITATLVVTFCIFPKSSTCQARFLLSQCVGKCADVLARHAASVSATADEVSPAAASTAAVAADYSFETLTMAFPRLAKLLQYAAVEQALLPNSMCDDVNALREVMVAAEALTLQVTALASTVEGAPPLRQAVLQRWWNSLTPFWAKQYTYACCALRDAVLVINKSEPDRVLDFESKIPSDYSQTMEANMFAAWHQQTVSTLTPIEDLQTIGFVSLYSWRVMDGIATLTQATTALQKSRSSIATLRFRISAWLLLLGMFLDPWRLLGRMCVAFARDCRHPSRLARDNVLHAVFKQVLAGTIALVIFSVTAVRSLAGDWQAGAWMYIAVFVSSFRTVDITVFRGLLRIAGTVAGGALGFLIMWSSVAATSPYILMAVVCVIAAIGTFVAPGPYRFAWILLLLSLLVTVSCQYVPGCACATLRYSVARTITMSTGTVVALLVNVLVLPVVAAREMRIHMGRSVRECGRLFESLLRRFIVGEKQAYHAVKVIERLQQTPPSSMTEAVDMALEESNLRRSIDSSRSAARQCAVEDTECLQDIVRKVRHTLNRVRTTLETETAAWRRGPFSIQPWFRAAVQRLNEVVHFLALLAVIINREIPISLTHSGQVYRVYLKHLRTDIEQIGACTWLLSLAVMKRLVREPPMFHHHVKPHTAQHDRASILAAAEAVESALKSFHERFSERRQLVFEQWLVKRQSDSQPPLSVFEVLRLYSCLHALHSAVDAFLQVAKACVQGAPGLMRR